MTFAEFYRQQYLERHARAICRLFHLFGLIASVVFLIVICWLQHWWMLLLLPLPSYFLAFFGHALVHNLPTTFEHPYWSFLAHWKMIGEMITGKL